jgi:endonuclease-8
VPEGDTIAAAADRLDAALRGAVVVAISGSHRSARANGRRLHGTTVTSVEARGKHVLIQLSNHWMIRTHLAMTGAWHVYRPDQRWRTSPGKARLVVTTADAVAVCFSAPTVEIAPTHIVAGSLQHLGPDLLDDGFDEAEYLRRAGDLEPATPVAEMLLHQRVVAGIGNVIKSETLFLEGIAPQTPLGELDDAALRALASRTRRLLLANRRGGPRNTTGYRNVDTWVYGRAGRPCLRCRRPIRSETQGDLDRVTYWCPNCQPR